MKVAGFQRGFSVVALGAALAGSGSAQTVVNYIWTGAVSNSLGAASNWAGFNAPPDDGSAFLVFPTNGASVEVFVDAPFTAHGLEFDIGTSGHVNVSGNASPLTILSGGVLVGDSGSFSNSTVFLNPDVTVVGSQEWSVGEHTGLYVWGDLSGSGDIIKTGAGSIGLSGNNSSYSGDLTISGGDLLIYHSNALGSGTLTLGDDTLVFAFTSDVVVSNQVRLGNGVRFGLFTNDSLTLAGDVELLQATTDLIVEENNELYIEGDISDSTEGETQLNVSGGGVLVLSGANSYTGGTNVDGSTAVVFANDSALPDTGDLHASLGGYIGAAYGAGLEEIVAAIGDPGSFTGAIGIDSYTTTTIFNGSLDFSNFDASEFVGIGSLTAGIIGSGATITPVEDFAYQFGGGGGTLTVQADLLGSNDIRVQSADFVRFLTVVLAGDNASTGALHVDHGVAVLDSADALGGNIHLAHFGYAGHTENWDPDFSAFLSRLASYQATSVIGIDSVEGSRSVANIDLSGLADTVFLGTASEATLAGTITPTSDGVLRLAAVKQGVLTVTATLDENLQGLEIGNGYGNMTGRGVVVIDGDNSTFGGDVLLDSGALIVRDNQALGTGSLVVTGGDFAYPTVLATDGASVTLANNLLIDTETVFQVGIPFLQEERDYDAFNSHSATTNLRLTGSVDTNGTLLVQGDTALTLAADNSDLTGRIELRGMSQLIAELDGSLGTARVNLGAGTDLLLMSDAPVIHGIDGGDNFTDIEINNGSFITLQPGAELTIVENDDATLYANIGGNPANPSDLYDYSPLPAVNATLVKEGSGILTLRGNNTFTGGTTIKAGTLLLEDGYGQPGSGAITIDGGMLASTFGGYNNDVQVVQGVLAGTGTFSSATIFSGAVLAPGYSKDAGSDAIGTITFSDLTLSGGGILEWNLLDQEGSPGSGWDLVSVHSPHTLSITADQSTPFLIRVSTVDAQGDPVSLGGFVGEQTYSWKVFSTEGISGFSADAFDFDTTSFTIDGFTVSPDSFIFRRGDGVNDSVNDLFLDFTPVPEPSTYALLGVGLGLAGANAWRRRRRSRLGGS